MMKSRHDIEILAPCGSYDILIAAIHAGADACYIGGNRFGARAYAENFDEKSIIDAIHYAHIHGAKIYLTVNTLFKDKEIQELYDYLLPFYEAGLDAVIVQDLGVFSLIRNFFPDLPIHCSTQMNITSEHAARMMKDMGATRVVTAREMSISEIREIHKKVDIEIETFVHGAMCYSYSGQCLMSSLAGGRSGNRGRCAQPCRKCYDGEYVLSLKDMCTLEHIPELIEAGVYSLKIEGRMKNACYVASAVHAYKEIVDLYFDGKITSKRIQELKFELANVFNRGNFSDGYMKKHNDADMISVHRPNNQGVCIGEVVATQAGAAKLRLHEQLYKQDVLEIPLKNGSFIEITTGVEGRKGKEILVNCPKTKMVKIGSKVFRTRCNHILSHIEQNYISNYKKIELTGKLIASVGKNLTFEVYACIDDKQFKGVAGLDRVERAKNRLEEIESLKKPLSQLGNTDYEMKNIELIVDNDAFVPRGMLKQLRRDAIEHLEYEIFKFYHRKADEKKQGIEFLETNTVDNCEEEYSCETGNAPVLANTIFSVCTYEQLEALLLHVQDENCLNKVILKPGIYEKAVNKGLFERISIDNIEFYADLPFVIKSRFSLSEYLQKGRYSGIYIRNIDGLATVLACEEYKKSKLLIGASLYCYNKAAYNFYKQRCFDYIDVSFEMPRELNISELEELGNSSDMAFIIYEFQPVMITANCIQKTKYGCDHANNVVKIRDDKGNEFFGQMHCSDCINVIYNGIPYNVMKQIDTIRKRINYKYGVVRFTIEDKEQVKTVLMNINDNNVKQNTTGHLFRGVE